MSSLTRSRTIQYIGILLALGLMAVGYWYFAVRAGVKTNTSGSQSQGVGDLSAGLAGYWKLDENTGTSAGDASTNGNAGTLTNGPTWTTGQIGSAVDFDGTDDYVTTPDADVLDTAVGRSRYSTVSGWFYRDTFTTDDTIVAKRNGIAAGDAGYIVYIDDATDQLIFEMSDGVDELSLTSVATFTATGWNHFAIVSNEDGSGFAASDIYVNGVANNATDAGNIFNVEETANAVAFQLGAESDAGNPFDGKLDEIRLYGRALSADEVGQLYRLTAPTGVDTSLKGYWSFDGAALSGTTAYDRSGAGNHGTLSNGPIGGAGRIGQALDFDGVNDSVDFGSASSVDNVANMTFCSWIKPQSIPNAFEAAIFSKTEFEFLLTLDGSQAQLNFFRDFTTSYGYWHATPRIAFNEWTHVCIAYSSGSTANDPTFYINGSATTLTEDAGPVGTAKSDAASSLEMGKYGFNEYFDGPIDEARLYNRILSAADIKSLYDRGAPDKTNTSAGQAVGTGNLNSGIAGYWQLDENTGTSAGDASVNGNTGTLTNGPTWSAGQIGSAVDFDGTNDYVSVADSDVLDFGDTDNFSISGWFNRDTATTDDNIISKTAGAAGYSIMISGSGDFVVFTASDGTDTYTMFSNSAFTAAGWHHFTITWDNSAEGNSRVYIDGADQTTSRTGTFANVGSLVNAAVFSIGENPSSLNSFDGKLDEIRVYDRAISPSEVSDLYRLTTPTSVDTDLKGYWSLNGDAVSGTTAFDRSGTGSNGTLTSGPTLTRGRVGQAMRLDGANDHLAIPAATPLNNQHTFTYAAWIYPTGATCGNGYGIIIEKGTGSGVKKSLSIDCSGASGDRTLYGTVDTATTDALSYTTDEVIVYNTWQHVAMTYDNAGDRKIRLYVNGREQPYVTQTAGTGTVATDTTDDIAIGATPSTQFYAFAGMIDEPRIYSRVLTESELTSLSAAGTPDKVNTSVTTPQGTGRLDGGLVGYWKLDENTGTSAGDTSTGGNTGTLTNGPTWTTGRIGSALSFDGTNDYVTMGDIAAAEGGNQVTAAAWIKQNGATNERHVLDKGDCLGGGSWELLVISGEADFYMPGLSHAVATGINVSDNQWHHIAATYDGAMQRIYVDGSLAGTYTGTASIASGTEAVEIGGHCQGGGSCGGSCYWNGQIDEARVYDRALSDDEVRQLYNLSAPTGTDTSLKGYWSFNGQDMSATTALDRSGAGNDGTLTGGPTKARGKLGQAMQFGNQVARYVNTGLGNGLSDLSQKTACAWINPVSYGSSAADATVFHRYDNNNGGGGWYLQLADDDASIQALYFTQQFSSAGGSWRTASGTIALNTWQHVCVTYDLSSTANDPTFYINGASSPATEYATPVGTADAEHATLVKLFIGNFTTDTTSSFDGSLDEVRIYNRVLSASEIKALYDQGR